MMNGWLLLGYIIAMVLFIWVAGRVGDKGDD